MQTYGSHRHHGIDSIHFLLVLSLIINAPIFSNDTHIFVQQGNVPILLTVPHGGDKDIVGGIKRKKDPYNPRKIVTGADRKIFELTETINTQLLKYGKKPYIVAAKFKREFIDPNRNPTLAYEPHSKIAKKLYDEYHNRIKQFIAEIKSKFPQSALLLDIHGQHKYPDAIFRGTQNGLTVRHMLDTWGMRALNGPHSILGNMKNHGYSILPIDTQNLTTESPFKGAFTVQTYGSHRSNGIDAIQIEIGSTLRLSKKKRTACAKDLADAILDFYNTYLT